MRHSLQAQVDYYKKMITNNPDWSFAGVYMGFRVSNGIPQRAKEDCHETEHPP